MERDIVNGVIQDVLTGDNHRACHACIHAARELALAKSLKLLLATLCDADPRKRIIEELLKPTSTVEVGKN